VRQIISCYGFVNDITLVREVQLSADLNVWRHAMVV